MRISIELIPRGETELRADADIVKAVLPQANAFNIPDLMRFPMRSWEACRYTRAVMPASIPHIRAIDVASDSIAHLADTIFASGLREVLIVRGDPPNDLSRRTYPNTSEDIIRRFKRHCPDLRIYAAFDPYRRGLHDEMASVRSKVDAGADGFFTQPFFDLRLLEICVEMLVGHDVFWGVAPVIGARSRAYWETTNRVIFPADFSADMAWNRRFATETYRMVRQYSGNMYFMPIRVDLASYLAGLVPD